MFRLDFSSTAFINQQGAESISDYAISFHYVRPKEMHALEFLIYKMKVSSEENPSDVNMQRNSNASWMQ